MGKRELIALLNLSSWCLVMVERLFLTVPRGCLQFVIVVFPDHTHLLFLGMYHKKSMISRKKSLFTPPYIYSPYMYGGLQKLCTHINVNFIK